MHERHPVESSPGPPGCQGIPGAMQRGIRARWLAVPVLRLARMILRTLNTG